MISNPEIARQINELMLSTFYRIEESVAMVERICPAGEATAYRKAAGRVAVPIVTEVLETLYAMHPTLKPANWDDE